MCEVCGRRFECRSPRGARFCSDHRKAPGPQRDKPGNDERRKARQRAQRAGAKALASTADFELTERMAIGLSQYPDDLESAARSVGLTEAGAQLEALAAEARRLHPALIDGDRHEFGRRLLATLSLAERNLSRAIVGGLIAPRDLAHATRALAQVHEIIAPPESQKFTHISLSVVGADGRAIELGNSTGPDGLEE